MTTVRLTDLYPIGARGLVWEGWGHDVETGEEVHFGGARDWAEPIAAAFEAGTRTELTIEPEGLVLKRLPAEGRGS